MAHQIEGLAASQDATAAAAAEISATPLDADVQALVDAAVSDRLAALGIETPAAVEAPVKSALETIASDVEHTTFVEKLEHLADAGYGAAVNAEPAVKGLVAVVENLVAKA